MSFAQKLSSSASMLRKTASTKTGLEKHRLVALADALAAEARIQQQTEAKAA